MKKKISVTVNGEMRTCEVEAHWSLLRFIREGLQLTGTKEGCGVGECGTCVVLINGQPIRSCLVLAVEVDGQQITTVEGISPYGALNPMQEAFIEHGAVQCGFCIPGFIVAGTALLARHPEPDQEQIDEAIDAHLCRCGNYANLRLVMEKWKKK